MFLFTLINNPRWSVCPQNAPKLPQQPPPEQTRPLGRKHEKKDSVEAPQSIVLTCEVGNHEKGDLLEPPQSIVFTSEAGGAEYSGFCLGQYSLVDVDQLTCDSRHHHHHDHHHDYHHDHHHDYPHDLITIITCLGQFPVTSCDNRQQRFYLDELKKSGRSDLVWRWPPFFFTFAKIIDQ